MEDTSIERTCERLVIDFAFFSDRGDYESLAALFTRDGTMVRPSGDVLIGREAIRKAYAARAAGRITRHICTNIRITVESADRARGLTYALIYSALADRPPDAHFGIKAEERKVVGEFEDEFLLTPDGWRIATRRGWFVMHT